MNLTGTVHSLPDKKNELMVSMGIMRTKVKLNDIEIVKEEDAATKFRNAKRKQATHTFSGGNAMSISPELKLLGLTVNEAISKLDKYIDDAYIAHLKSVRIVHGKGTGALRKAVQDYLATNAYVKSYDKAAYGEGDDGVTVVKLF
jgi:DNA mismatch repair protein MutS2